MSTESTVELSDMAPSDEGAGAGTCLALVIAWSAEEPHRIGEIATFPRRGAARVLGRGGDPGITRVGFARQRPGRADAQPPLGGKAISRDQLRIHPAGDALRVERIGRCGMLVNGAQAEQATVAAGDTVLLRGQLLLLCVERPVSMPAARFAEEHACAFGEPDASGLLGESPVAWSLRDRIAFAAKADTHVLLLGPSGSGKELAARAVHALSRRAKHPFVARNAATLPAGLIDAELFGNVKNYPNAGMPERPGLIGQADGGTLFLDEIAELPQELQTHMLRVLDGDGEYQRLGEATTRTAALRLVGATNRPAEALKHDLVARMTVRVELPPLDARREDIPLLVRHLLREAARRSPEIAARFLAVSGGHVAPRIDGAFVDVLVRRKYETHVRELDALLWRAMSESDGATLRAPAPAEPDAKVPLEADSGPEPDADKIREALAAARGSITEASKRLGLTSRYALYRLMKKHGIAPQGAGEGDT